MKSYQIKFILINEKYLGLIPECVLLKTNTNGEFMLDYIHINKKNKNNYSDLFDERKKTLLNACMQLDPDEIVTKINDPSAKKWETFAKKYILTSTYNNAFESYSKYIKDYIQSYLNKFYENIDENDLYLKKGEFPSLWEQIGFEDANPEVFYNFEFDKNINYQLNILNDNNKIAINGCKLLTNEPARILKKNTIIEFEKGVNGKTLKPFFTTKSVEVPINKTEEYFNTFVKSLINNDKKVIAKGFAIEYINAELNPVLEIKFVGNNEQLSFFEENKKSVQKQKVCFSLFFEYDNFRFQCGHNASNVILDKKNDTYIFKKFERKKFEENLIINELKKLGIDIKNNSQYQAFEQGIEWINNHYQTILNLGLEIRQDKKNLAEKKYFIGSTSINAEATINIDWFEIKGVVNFGEFVFSLLDIIKLIRQNKREILLPNGEFAIFPDAWIEEYYYLSKYSFIKEDKMYAAKHHLVLLNQLKSKGSMKLTLNPRLQAFLDSDNYENYDLPKGFNGELRNYQREGYNWLRFLHELKFGACLADDMGLGKTIQTLCLLQWIKEQVGGCSLLVVPKSLIYNWQIEATRFCPDLKILIYTGKNRKEKIAEFSDYDLVLTSYPILRTDIELIQTQAFYYSILDESQYIKNPRSEIARNCLQINAMYFLTLTGTPIENSISDIWTQMNFLNRNMLGNLSFFLNEFNSDDKIPILQKMLNPFILRRLKTTVAKDLPEKYINVQYCDMTSEQLDIYKKIKNEYRNKILDATEKSTLKFNLLEGLLRMRQIANHPKLMEVDYTESSGKFDLACDLLNTIVSEGNKVLIFSSFVEHLKLYKNYLESKSIAYCYLDGQTKNREEEVKQFQTNPHKLVFLLSLKAGGVGLNLTAAEYVFLLDPWWNPAAEAQAFDRTHRIGQKNNVFIYKFITRSSIEEKIIELQQRKTNLADNLIQAEEGFVKNLNKADIEFLLN